MIRSLVFILLAGPLMAFSQNWTCGNLLYDSRDGLSYNTVQVGGQCWMAENLNHGQQTMSYDSAYLYSAMSNNYITEKYCLSNDSTKCYSFGGLYDWNEMMGYSTSAGTQGICPTGWHIPSDEEWQILLSSLGVMQSQTDSLGWLGTNQGDMVKLNGTSGFNALYGEGRNYDGKMGTIPTHAYYWTSTNNSPQHAWYYHISDSKQEIYRSYSYKTYGYSVRCIKDTSIITGMNMEESQLFIYPNPTERNIIVQWGKHIEYEYNVSLMDLKGAVVKSYSKLSSKKHVIEVESLTRGLYLLKVESPLTAKTFRIVLQ